MELRDRILRALGQHGAMSVKALGLVVPNEPKLEQELHTMVRRRLVEEPFEGSFTLTDRGKKEYEALVPPRPALSRVEPGGAASAAWLHGWDENATPHESDQGTIWDDVGDPMEESEYDEGYYEGEEEFDGDDD